MEISCECPSGGKSGPPPPGASWTAVGSEAPHRFRTLRPVEIPNDYVRPKAPSPLSTLRSVATEDGRSAGAVQNADATGAPDSLHADAIKVWPAVRRVRVGESLRAGDTRDVAGDGGERRRAAEIGRAFHPIAAGIGRVGSTSSPGALRCWICLPPCVPELSLKRN